MKKSVFILVLFCGFTLVSFATPGGKTTTESIFYGTKASSNANNPCKGETTRVCGRIVVTTEYCVDSLTNAVFCKETKVILDAEGKEAAKEEKIVPTNQTYQVVEE
jgi:hypothetical protein